MKHLSIHKLSFKNVIFLAIESKMYLKNSAKTSLPYLNFKTDHAFCHEESKKTISL